MAAQKHLIESPTRLSDSQLWKIQENYFALKGASAWQNEIPFFISSNAFIGSRYAQLVIHMIGDLLARGPAPGPLYIVEIGAGHGKFSFYFLKAFSAALKHLGLEALDYRYIITDVAESNIDFCQKNEAFAPYIESNRMDFGVFDARHQDEFELRIQSVPFSSIKPQWPVVYICNYVFDILPHDAFRFEGDTLYELQVELTSRYQVFNADKPKRLKDVQIEQFYSQVEDVNHYYAEPDQDALLQYYRRYFEGKDKGFFLFPIGAMRFADKIKRLSTQSVILCGDKGVALKDNLSCIHQNNFYSYDGCFAFSVNMHALGAYLKGKDGDYLPTQHQNYFNTVLYSQGINFENMPYMKAYFQDELEMFGADEFCFINEELALNGYRFSLKACLSILRLSHYDPFTYNQVHQHIMNQFDLMNAAMVKDVIKALIRVEENLFHDKTTHDAFAMLGCFYSKAKQYKKAEELFQLAIKHSGNQGFAYQQLGLLFEKRGNSNRAIEHYQQAVAKNPKDKFSRSRIRTLEGSPMNALIPLSKALFVTAVCAGLLYLSLNY